MDVLSDLLPTDRKQSVNLLVAVHAVLSFCFAISSFVAADNDNAGFNVILTALMYVAFVAGSFYVLTRFGTPLSIGFLIGVATCMCLTSLQTAVYWGQLSGCSAKHSGELSQCTCNHVAAMRAVSAFASLSFIVELVLTAGLVSWKDELMDDDVSSHTAYSDIGGGASGPDGGGVGAYKYDASSGAATADL